MVDSINQGQKRKIASDKCKSYYHVRMDIEDLLLHQKDNKNIGM